jgi:hypothetical protein
VAVRPIGRAGPAGTLANRRTPVSWRALAATPAPDAIARRFDLEFDWAVDCEPASYRHWAVEVDGEVATVTMQVRPHGGLRDDYELKLDSYDLGVDVELDDVVQRLRFEHPAVKVVVLTSALDKVFCAGANIQMLAAASHHHKVNFPHGVVVAPPAHGIHQHPVGYEYVRD